MTSRPELPVRRTASELLIATGEGLAPGRAAEVYAAAGLPVLPLYEPAPTGGCTCGDGGCERPGKHPRVRGGVHAATTNPQVLRRWWERWPAANVALATGVVFDVCDIDSAEGVEALRAILSNAGVNVAQVPLVRTGGGGWHLLFAPTGLGCPMVDLDGVDWRGRGGYIVAPPSRHPSGHRYRWIRPLGDQLPEVPTTLQAHLERPRPATGGAVASLLPASRWAAAALAAEADRVATTPKGARGRKGRNHALNRAAFKLGQLVAASALDPDEVARALLGAALQAGLGEREAARTIDYGLAAGIANPRPVLKRAVGGRGR